MFLHLKVPHIVLQLVDVKKQFIHFSAIIHIIAEMLAILC